MSSRQPKKHVKSSAMKQRIAHLESKLSKKLVVHARKAKIPKSMSMKGAPNRVTKSGGVKGNFVSLVTDSVNVGSVWKNTTAERVTFPIAREKVLDLASTGTSFQTLVQQYVNPGNSLLFPIFSQIAKNYEEYIPNTLRFYYRTEEYMASGSNVSAGLAALGTNFDPDAPNFPAMTELENYEHSISGPPFSGIIVHDVVGEHRKRFKGKGRGDLSLNNYFVNYAPNQLAPANTPAKFYDMGNFQLAVNGTQSGVIGELWVEYSFTMIRRLQQNGAPSGGFAHFQAITGSTGAQLTGMALQSGNTLSGITMTAQTITFPANQSGNYLVATSLGGGTSCGALALSTTTGGVSTATPPAPKLFTIGSADQTTTIFSGAGVTSAPSMSSIVVNVTALTGTLVYSSPTVVGTGYGDVFIISIPPSVLTVDVKEEEIHTLQNQLNSQQDLIDSLIASMASLRSSSQCSSSYNSVSQDDISPVYEDVNGALRIDTSHGPSSLPPNSNRQSVVEAVKRSMLAGILRQ
jgi:hypothetical protein